VASNCRELLPRLCPIGLDGSVVSKAVEYAIEAALQQSFDSLGEAVKEHMAKVSFLCLLFFFVFQKIVFQHHRVPVVKTAPSNEFKRPEKVVLSSPFVQQKPMESSWRRDFAKKLGITVSGDDEPCTDISEFFYFLLLSNQADLIVMSSLTTHQQTLFQRCKGNV
jgi:hypothetical protein